MKRRGRTTASRPEATPSYAGRLLGTEPVAPPRSFGAAAAQLLRGAFVENATLKFVALVLSLTVFILVHSDEEKTAFSTIGVFYDPSDQKVLVSKPVENVRIEVKGSRRRIKRLHEADLDGIHLDPDALSDGPLSFRPEMVVNLPEGLEVVSFDPSNVNLRFEKRMTKSVAVSVDTVGSLGRGFRVDAITVEPKQVTISGAASRVSATTVIETMPVPLDGRSRSFRMTVDLAPPPEIKVEDDAQVQVQVTLDEEQGTRQVQLPVSIQPGRGLGPADVGRFVVDPDSVQVVLRGSILAIDQVRENQLSAYVKLEEPPGGRTKTAEVRVAPALSGIGFEISPSEVTIKPREEPRPK